MEHAYPNQNTEPKVAARGDQRSIGQTLGAAPSERALEVTDMVHEIAHSIVDIITAYPEEEQAALLALLMTFVGEEYLQRRT